MQNAPHPKNGIGKQYLEETPIGTAMQIIGGVVEDVEKIPGAWSKLGTGWLRLLMGPDTGGDWRRMLICLGGNDGLLLAEKRLDVLGRR